MWALKGLNQPAMSSQHPASATHPGCCVSTHLYGGRLYKLVLKQKLISINLPLLMERLSKVIE